MGLTFVEVTVTPLNDPTRVVVDQFLVDSGASDTVLPEDIWKSLGLEAQDHIRIRLADGRVVSRPVAFAMIRFDGHAAPSRVILGEADDSKLLGVVTLEEMGLALDPLKRTLSAMEIRM
ncbi:MAG: aspartyl protease [Phycisphaerales bacterium]|nr:MAG: aspartyl protease [Phycisphaerales bacterium]